MTRSEMIKEILQLLEALQNYNIKEKNEKQHKTI